MCLKCNLGLGLHCSTKEFLEVWSFHSNIPHLLIIYLFDAAVMKCDELTKIVCIYHMQHILNYAYHVEWLS